jgi:hypothetical protein
MRLYVICSQNRMLLDELGELLLDVGRQLVHMFQRAPQAINHPSAPHGAGWPRSIVR